jgi:hypothetical protein
LAFEIVESAQGARFHGAYSPGQAAQTHINRLIEAIERSLAP